MGFDEKQVAIIPQGTVIKGNIEIDGKLEMYGKITGNIKSNDRINLCGEVYGDISANDLYTKDSYVEGNISANEGVVVRENTVVFGDVKATSLIVDGAIQGKFDIHGNMTVGETAKIDGDIKAKSVQIANGAATNGRLDLCYADIKAKDVFPKVFNTNAKVVEGNKAAKKIS